MKRTFLALASAALLGCGSGSGGSNPIRVPLGSTAAPASSSTSNVGSGAIAKNGPAIAITAPARGEFCTQPVVRVEGTVTDPLGVASLTVAGNAVVPNANGTFSETVSLVPGMNTILIEATNTAQRASKASLSVECGPFLPLAQPIPQALAVRMNAEGLTAIGNAASSQLGGAALAQQILARNPLYKNSIAALGFTIASCEIDAVSASFGQPTLRLAPVAGALSVHAEVPNVDLVANAHDFGGIPFSITGHVTATNAVVDAEIVFLVQNGALTSTVRSSSVQLQGFGWGLNGIPSFFTGLASSFVQGLVQDEIQKQVSSVVPQELDKALAGLTHPFTQTVLGARVSFAVAPSFVLQDALGMSLAADANVGIAPRAGYTALPSPGSFYKGGAAPQNGGPAPGFLASFDQDLMNRAAHAAWSAGLLDFEVSNQPSSSFALPPSFVLDGAFIQTWIPELAGKFPAGDPLAVVLSAKLPPVFQAKPKPDTLEVALGELELSVYDIAPGRPRQLLITLAVHLRITAQAVVANGVVGLHMNPNIFVDVSLVTCPLAPQLDAHGASNFVQFSLPVIAQIAANTWSGFALPVYPGLSPKNIDVDADGAQKTYLTVKGDL